MYPSHNGDRTLGKLLSVRCAFGVAGLTRAGTVGFHNFNLRILNLRVSNPNKLIVDVFFTRCLISMCQGLGPKNTITFRKSTV